MEVVTDVALGILLVSAVLVVVRLVKGPTTLDRAAAADVFVAILLCGVAVLVARRGSTVFVPVLLALSLLGFASSVAVVRFLGREDPVAEPDEHGGTPGTDGTGDDTGSGTDDSRRTAP